MGVIEGPVETLGAVAPTGPAAVEAHAVSRSYGPRVAVSEVELTVVRGTVLGLLGPNGAGKTTLIRLLSTVLTPDAGSFAVDGVPHTEPDALRRRIGVLPESAGFPRSRTCREWLTYHARLYGLGRGAAAARADRVLAEVGLAERRGSLIGTLSRGMRQRLGIARALVNEPRVVFLDEPTLGLDPLGQRQVLGLVHRVARERGVTVVLSTHVLDEVEHSCDRVVILNRGRVVADGTVAEVVRRAAAPREGRIRVPSYLGAEAAGLLAVRGLLAPGHGADAPPGVLTMRLSSDQLPEQAATLALRQLLEADIPVLELSWEGGRLSDAFLAVTGGGRHE